MSKESVKPVEILTEEELEEIETMYGLNIDGGHRNYSCMVALIASHRELFKSNAELSFKNQKLKEAMVIVVENMELIRINHAALEELE